VAEKPQLRTTTTFPSFMPAVASLSPCRPLPSATHPYRCSRMWRPDF
jgi:hypothetical protein